MATEPPRYVEAVPFSGYLAHAVRNQPEFFHRSSANIVTTFHRALCGVGRGGMRVRLGRDDGEPIAWFGVDGCDACHRRVKQITEAREKQEEREAPEQELADDMERNDHK